MLEKWKGDGAGRMTIMFGAAGERSMTELECDKELLTIVLAGREPTAGRVLGNSYVVGHGSYPR